MWDPGQYQLFAGHRGRPFHDLLARVGATGPGLVADLGCGPGDLTATLAARGLERLGPQQTRLEGDETQARAAQLDALIDSLSNRLGPSAVWRPMPVESHAPERAVDRRDGGAEHLR